MFSAQVLVGTPEIRLSVPLRVAFSAWVRHTTFSLRHVDETDRDYNGKMKTDIEFRKKKNHWMKLSIQDYPSKKLRRATARSLKNVWVRVWDDEKERPYETTDGCWKIYNMKYLHIWSKGEVYMTLSMKETKYTKIGNFLSPNATKGGTISSNFWCKFRNVQTACTFLSKFPNFLAQL